VTRLSNGSVVVDFVTLVERNSNTTKNTIVNALIDGNSTGTLGVVLTGNINIEEIIELSTNIPTTRAVKKESDQLEKWIIVTITAGAVVIILILIIAILAHKYRRVVRARSDELILENRNWKFMEDNQGTMRATASEDHCNSEWRVVRETEMN